jgi:hypothetical protein
MLRSSLCEAGLCGVVRVLTIGTADTGCLPLISNHQRPLDHLGVCKGTWSVRRQADRAGVKSCDFGEIATEPRPF